MPLDEGTICEHCSDGDGGVKSCEEVFEGGVKFFMEAVEGTEKDLAERLVRKNMNRLPYWQENKGECLNGEEASDEEFMKAMLSLS